MMGRQTDCARVRNMAARIMDPAYTLVQFNEDLRAFPELDLYLLITLDTAHSPNNTSSSRTIGDEYQRTIGAFFAVYWLMRLHIDGKEGFSFGVTEEWSVAGPSKAEERPFSTAKDAAKRLTFHRDCQWDYFVRLLMEAQLLEEIDGELKANEERLVSLITLTALHDIMKMTSLLPTVQPEHGEYHGYAVGDRIGDHDHALSYVMDHYPELLPSFTALAPEQRRALQFAQCNLCFNHGWFVQAEAPPGAIFKQMREVLSKDRKSEVTRRDLALYFVHWLTDLAGAMPTPLLGCEQFAVKFPLPVLNSFLRSFEFVERIVDETETEVMEAYLQVRWEAHTPSPGPLPSGEDAITRMRLLCMAQANALQVLAAFGDLPAEDRELLALEMSRTGCVGQAFSSSLVPQEVVEHEQGPAFLVYYGPAFLQHRDTSEELRRRLLLLTEVYRCARGIWPATEQQAGSTVIIRIDAIKGMSISEMRSVELAQDMLLMLKGSANEAVIERASKTKFDSYLAAGQRKLQALDLKCIA